MRTKDVRVAKDYLYQGCKVMVIERIQGEETVKRQMQSGEVFTGMHRQRKKFLLSNGKTVYSEKLKEIS